MSEKDNVHVCDEIGEMFLLDFLRKYQGSPAISTLTINKLLGLVDGAKLAEGVVAGYINDELIISDDIELLPDCSSNHDAVTPESENSDEIFWALKSNEHNIMKFRGFEVLKSWVEHCAKDDTDILISLDGNEWKPYVEVEKNLIVSADSAIEAFKMARIVGSGSEIVGVEGPGSPDCFKGDPASLVMRTKPAALPLDSETVLWKLRGKRELTYNFVNFASLIKWASNLDDQDRLRVSIDGGRTWKAYGEVMAIIFASGSTLTPFEAFGKAEPIEASADSTVEAETSSVVEIAPEVASASDMAPIVSTISESEAGPLTDQPIVVSESDGAMVLSEDVSLSDEEPPDVSDELESVGELPNYTDAPPVDKIIWKLRSKRGLTYNFSGFEALQKWAYRLPDASEEILISLDGLVWKSYAQVSDLLKSGVQLHDAYEVATPIKFREPSLTEIPKVNLSQCGIVRETVEILPREICENECVVPVALKGNVLVVAMNDPNDLDVVNLIRGITPYDISRVMADENQIREVLKSFYPD